jgi:hypothetical protein
MVPTDELNIFSSILEAASGENRNAEHSSNGYHRNSYGPSYTYASLLWIRFTNLDR